MIAVFCTKLNEAKLDDRFGRCDQFTVVNIDTGEIIKNIENKAKNSSDSAGTRAAQIILDTNADILIAPLLGPKAFNSLSSFPVKIYNQGKKETISEALDAYKAESLALMTNPKGQGLHKA